jgi:hypothetical protein
LKLLAAISFRAILSLFFTVLKKEKHGICGSLVVCSAAQFGFADAWGCALFEYFISNASVE